MRLSRRRLTRWITRAQNSKLRKHDTSLEQLCLEPPEVHLSLRDRQSIWKNNVCLPGRTRSQKRSRRWFPGWTPSHRSPVWSSPTQQRNTRFIERPWSFLQTHLGSRLKTTLFLKTNFIHLQVHLCRSLLEVTQGFRWAFGVVSAAAGRDALLFKVLCVAPVGEIMHPAAMQLHGNENGYSAVTNALQVFWLKNIKKKRGRDLFSSHDAMTWHHCRCLRSTSGGNICSDQSSMREQRCFSALCAIAALLKWPYINKRSLVCTVRHKQSQIRATPLV